MDLIDRLIELANRVRRQQGAVKTEEAVKTAFIMPFIQALGYDVFNPLEVIPEHTADHGVKKGEKVDYAIQIDEKIVMLIECKQVNAKLETRHASQLFRYFTVTDAKFGVLTDGVRYLFYTDLETANVMDDRPFFEFNITDFEETDVEQLKKFGRGAFDVEAITSTASDMKYLKALRNEFQNVIASPPDEFVRMLFGRVNPKVRFTSQLKDSFAKLTKTAIDEQLKELIYSRLRAAATAESAHDESDESGTPTAVSEENESPPPKGIVTTPNEEGAFRIIQAIASELTEPENITIRDGQVYCAILFKNNNRRPVARLYFDKKTRLRVGIFLESGEVKHSILKITEITKLKTDILAAVQRYL